LEQPGLIAAILIFTLLIILGFIGMIVEKGSCGDKPNLKNSMVEAVDEDNTS